MIITAGCPIVVTLDGIQELSGQPANTETRLYWEQQLDLGEAIIQDLDDLYPEGRPSGFWWGYTHRLTNSTGGQFHITVTEGVHELQPLRLPDGLALLQQQAEELGRMVRQMQTLLLANRLLEAENARLKGDVSTLEISNEQLERHLSA